MRSTALLGVLITSLVTGCSGTLPVGASASPSTTTEARPAGLSDLRRPLRATPLSVDGSCPVDHGVWAAEFPGAQGFVSNISIGYVAYGRGPVAPAITTRPDAAVLSFTDMPKQNGQAFQKVIWIVAPGTVGPILVRVIAADGRRAKFMSGDELELPGPGTHPEGYVYFPAPGCYSFQVDYSRGTDHITVLVRP